MKPAHIELAKRVGMILLALAALCSPLLLYVSTFGFVPSTSHPRWAEFGSAMGGIYGPILTVMTLWLLVLQYRMQRQMSIQQANQLLLSRASDDIQTNLEIIAKAVEKKLVGMTDVRRLLLTHFEDATVEQLLSDGKHEFAWELEAKLPEIYMHWSAVYSDLSGLKKLEGTAQDGHLVSLKFKLISTLGFPLCRALDNYLFAITRGRTAYPYGFNPSLPQESEPFNP